MRKKIEDKLPVVGSAQPQSESKSQASSIEDMVSELKSACESAYEGGVTLEEAEKLAARCLQVQMTLAEELSKADLDSRMRKNGVKALRASIYLAEVSKSEKKPSDVMLEQIVNSDAMVGTEEKSYHTADARRASLETYLGILKDAHIYFRGISKGRYE